MIRHLKIQRFRSIHAAELEFGKINLFIGPNGAGKSNVLEAIGILSAAAARGVDETSLRTRGVRLSRPHMFKSSFRGLKAPQTFRLEAALRHHVDLKYTITIESGSASPYLNISHETLSAGAAPILGRSPRGQRVHRAISRELTHRASWPIRPEQSFLDATRSILNLSKDQLLLLHELSEYAIYAPSTAVMRGVALEPDSQSPLGLSGSGLASAIADVSTGPMTGSVLTQIMRLSSWVSDVIVGPRDPNIIPDTMAISGKDAVYFQDRFMKPSRNLLSTYDASEGTLYLAFVAVLLAHAQAPPVFALDNVDSTLNPALVTKLVSFIADLVCRDDATSSSVARQVFLTSHNPTALDALDLFNEEHRVFIVHRSRSDRGSTKFLRLQPPPGMTRSEWVLEKHGMKLSNLWIDGHLPEALG